MLKRALVFALTALVVALRLLASGVWPSPEAEAGLPRQSELPWLRHDSRRFEIHYQRAVARDLDRVVRSAEAAYDHISRRLSFSLGTRVPLIVFAPSGSMTLDQVVEYSGSDQVAPPEPHRSRIVLPRPHQHSWLPECPHRSARGKDV